MGNHREHRTKGQLAISSSQFIIDSYCQSYLDSSSLIAHVTDRCQVQQGHPQDQLSFQLVPLDQCQK